MYFYFFNLLILFFCFFFSLCTVISVFSSLLLLTSIEQKESTSRTIVTSEMQVQTQVQYSYVQVSNLLHTPYSLTKKVKNLPNSGGCFVPVLTFETGGQMRVY